MRLTSSAMLLVLLAPAGCGGEESPFADDYNRAVKPLTRLGEGLDAKPATFDRLARRTERTRTELAKLDAPEDAQDEFEAMLARLDEVKQDLSAMARAERSKNVVRQRRAARELVRSGSAFERAERALRRAVEG